MCSSTAARAPTAVITSQSSATWASVRSVPIDVRSSPAAAASPASAR